jgi:TrmH family RNA methyltransferase
MLNKTEILSIHNPRVKIWSQLLDRKGRTRHGQFLLEGTHLVQEALKAGAPVRTVAYSLDRGIPAELGNAEVYPQSVEWIGVGEAVLDKCTATQTPQSVFAVVDKVGAQADAFTASRDALVVVVDGVQDPGNLGTIIRNADAAGASGVLLGAGTADLYNPKTVRATMGSLFHLPIAECSLPDYLWQARNQGIQLINTSLQGSMTCYDIDFTKPTWIVLGNEGKGVSAEVAALVDVQAVIPMKGQAESLNVAMASAVLLFEALRQRHHR